MRWERRVFTSSGTQVNFKDSLKMYSKNNLVLGEPDSREAQQAIALSLEENNWEDGEKEKDDEEELLKQAIALSLEDGDEM